VRIFGVPTVLQPSQSERRGRDRGDEHRLRIHDRKHGSTNASVRRAAPSAVRGEARCYDADEAVTTAADLRAAAFLKVVTWARVALVPVILALILAGPENETAFTIAAVLFAIAALTDFFDGLLARRWAQTSVFGNFLDTTADKLLVAGALIGLLVRVSPWIAVIIIGREILIIGLKGAVASTGDLVRPSVWGKAKANVQFLAIFLAILRPGEPIGPLYLDQWAMIAAAIITVLSGLEYVVRFRGSITTGRDPAA
jgi:CDP-diacylglycerol--glycerol-3-phosphate 3-phosphatidyltransferase